MKFSVFQVSRKGDRKINQDRVGYCYSNDAVLLALADGMGGHPMGEVAAQIALQTSAAEFQIAARPTLRDPRAFLQQATLAAHHNIMSFSRSKNLGDSPRTTIVLCVLQANKVQWAHVGDSRLYLLRDKSILRRTKDHSHIEYLMSMNNGKIPAGQNPNRSALYTCLGSHIDPIMSFSEVVELKVNDVLLLCSDGLWAQIDERQMVNEVFENPLERSLPRISDQAVVDGRGKSDNVSVLSLAWEGSEEPVHEPVAAVAPPAKASYATTIMMTRTDEVEVGNDIHDLDDDSIDKSISEINESIRSAASRRKKPRKRSR